MTGDGGTTTTTQKQPFIAQNQAQQQQPTDADNGKKSQNAQSCLWLYRKPFAVNVACLVFLLVYSILGGFIFLHFEEPNWQMQRQEELAERIDCVQHRLVHQQKQLQQEAKEEEARRRNDRILQRDLDGGGGGGRGAASSEEAATAQLDKVRQNVVILDEREEEEELQRERDGRRQRTTSLAGQIVADCVLGQGRDERMDWNLKNAVLFGFGILTTLGYGRIEPQTTEGRLFTVVYGFLGVPFTVIIFTNFGRYLQKLERWVRKCVWRRWRQRLCHKAAVAAQKRRKSCILPPITVQEEFDDDICRVETAAEFHQQQQQQHERIEEREGMVVVEEADDDDDGDDNDDQCSPGTLICIVFLYLLLGAALIDWLDEQVDFPNGIYFAFLCLTAIEYGKLIPTDALYLPLVIAYICFGLAISTIALDIGSTYVKKLYYLGRKIKNIAGIRIWFGAKHLRVRELLAALGHNIGLEPTVLCDLDLEQLITNAIQVKEGRLHRVPQTHMIMDGIWPPELVPLFLKDGHFPDWVDAEERRRWSVASMLAARRRSIRGSARSGVLSVHTKMSNGSALSARSAHLLANQPPDHTPPLPPLLPEKLSVRFEEFVHTSNNEKRWPNPSYYLDTSTSGVASASELSSAGGIGDEATAAVPFPMQRWSFADDDGGGGGHHQQQQHVMHSMRRSETVPPTGHPDSSLHHLCAFPSLEFRSRKTPLPPMTPLPDDEDEMREGIGGDNNDISKVDDQ